MTLVDHFAHAKGSWSEGFILLWQVLVPTWQAFVRFSHEQFSDSFSELDPEIGFIEGLLVSTKVFFDVFLVEFVNFGEFSWGKFAGRCHRGHQLNQRVKNIIIFDLKNYLTSCFQQL